MLPGIHTDRYKYYVVYGRIIKSVLHFEERNESKYTNIQMEARLAFIHSTADFSMDSLQYRIYVPCLVTCTKTFVV